MYVKLDCHWLKHPFPRNTFKVQSAAEIAVILRLGQVAIYVDASRSDPESLTKVQVPGTAVGNHQEASQALPTLVHGSEEEQSIINKKEGRIHAYLRCQEWLKKAAADH